MKIMHVKLTDQERIRALQLTISAWVVADPFCKVESKIITLGSLNGGSRLEVTSGGGMAAINVTSEEGRVMVNHLELLQRLARLSYILHDATSYRLTDDDDNRIAEGLIEPHWRTAIKKSLPLVQDWWHGLEEPRPCMDWPIFTVYNDGKAELDLKVEHMQRVEFTRTQMKLNNGPVNTSYRFEFRKEITVI